LPALFGQHLGEARERILVGAFVFDGYVLPGVDVDPGHRLTEQILADLDQGLHVLLGRDVHHRCVPRQRFVLHIAHD
jgi:hypothetical protein